MSVLESENEISEFFNLVLEGEIELYEEGGKRGTIGNSHQAVRDFRRYIDSIYRGLENNVLVQKGDETCYKKSTFESSKFERHNIPDSIPQNSVSRIFELANELQEYVSKDITLVENSAFGNKWDVSGSNLSDWNYVKCDTESLPSIEEENQVLEYVVAKLEREHDRAELGEIFDEFSERTEYVIADNLEEQIVKKRGKNNLSRRMEKDDNEQFKKVNETVYKIDRNDYV
ncbi:MAG: hypothetical protein H8Z69_03945 [Nanohaloarchaea archaeon]|nr:hypothetical protein [Candidatus Nanohaloarchaea archaeon]